MSSRPGQQSLIGALWRYRWMTVLIVLLVASLATVAGYVLSPVAQATASMALSTPPENNVLSPGTVGDASQGRYTSQRAQYVLSDAVLTDVAERLGEGSPPSLRKQLSVTPSGSNNTLVITADADSAAEALALASAVVEAYREQTTREVQRLTDAAISSIRENEQRIRDGVAADDDPVLAESAAATLSQLATQASEIQTSSALFGDGVESIKAPTIDSVSTRSLPLRELALGIIVGLGLASAVAWLRADSDRRVMTALQAEQVLEAPILTEVRRKDDVSLPSDVDLSSLPSFYYQLAMAGLQRDVDKGIVALTGPDPDANAVAALNLAIAAQRQGRNTLLIDGTQGQGRLPTVLGIAEAGHGVAEALASEGWKAHVRSVSVDEHLALSFLPGGEGAGDGSSRQEIATTLDEWRADFDLTLIAGTMADWGVRDEILLAGADEAVLVVPRGSEESFWLEARRQLAVLRTGLSRIRVRRCLLET